LTHQTLKPGYGPATWQGVKLNYSFSLNYAFYCKCRGGIKQCCHAVKVVLYSILILYSLYRRMGG